MPAEFQYFAQEVVHVCDGRIILFWLGGENYSFYICMH